MKNKLKTTAVLSLTTLIFIAVFTLSACGGASSRPDSVSTDGSTSIEKVIGSLGEQFTIDNPRINFTYNPTGSGSGIAAVLEGRCDIGLSSRPLKDEEKKGLRENLLAYDGIGVIVNPENPLSNLNKEELSAIYTGETSNWKDIGGKDASIVVIGREAGSGTRDGFESINDIKDRCIYRQELTSTGDVITSVAQNPDAIGYASLESITKRVKTLDIDGVSPSEDSIRGGTYLLRRPFMLITKTDTPLSESAQAFFDYIISPEAAHIISGAGAVTKE